MESRWEWWHRNGWTVALLLSAFGFAFAIRTIWTYPVIQQWGALYTYAGGSDSYYHSRVMTYIIQNHTNLIRDPLLKFPFGGINPREPLFDWMNATLGIVFAPLFGGNAVNAGAWFLALQGPLWAALGVFPVYLIGKEVSSQRTGLIAAMIFPFLPASIDSSIFGYANYLSFYTFIILVVVYSWIRTLKAVGTRRYVGSYRDPKQIYGGLRSFLRYERTGVKWAVFTGVSLGALALAWQGYTYAVVIIALSIFILAFAERIRRVDSFGLYVAAWIVGLVGFPMAIPYYLVQQQFNVWFSLPLLLYFGVLALLLPFILLRDTPWVVSVPVLAGLVAAAAGILAIFSPNTFASIVTGQGYFVKNLIYTTVAEAQAPSIDQLVISYGVITFFVAFVGIALFVYQIIRGRFPRAIVAFLVFAVLSVYLPISAAKFFLLGSPAFALLPAEALRRALDVAGYPELRRTVASLTDTRSRFGAFRRAFKIRHVLVMALVVGLILPNVWISIDAGIPGNTKSAASTQVAASLPSWLQPSNGLTPSQAYFGAAGTSLDTAGQYDSAGYNWLAQQDTNLPAPNRPAFVSWWDYGFQAIDQGQHPSVADNFQNGIDPAGQFILAQNESLGIGVLATTLLQAEQKAGGYQYLPPSLNGALALDGVNVPQLHNLLVNESYDLQLVIAHPERYLPVNPATITADNAMYLAVSYFLADSLSVSGVSKVYDDLQGYTGWSIRYDMVDSRLFPFSGTDTGIFYAPADLTGRVIDAAGLPSSYFNVTVIGSNGQAYPLGQLPAGVSAVNYQVNYFAPFFNSFIYRTYIGYNGTDIGVGPGIPGLSSNPTLANSPIEPGWMMQHFQVVYRTAYYCSSKSQVNDSNCFVAENLPTAKVLANRTGGVANSSAIRYFQGGESMLEYYPGQTLLGSVALPGGTPVSGVRVTVFDQWGIPHMSTFTAKDGAFSVVLPPGNDTLNLTMGTLAGLPQQGSILLKSVRENVSNAVGLSLSAPTLVQNIVLPSAQVGGVVFWNIDNNTTYVPTIDTPIAGAHILLSGGNGLTNQTAVTDADGTFSLPNVPPGSYNYTVTIGGHSFAQPQQIVQPGKSVNASVGLKPGKIAGEVLFNGLPIANSVVTIANASAVVATTVSNGTGDYRVEGLGPGNYSVIASGPFSNYRSVAGIAAINSEGGNTTVDLRLVPSARVQFDVLSGGQPVAGIPVRFTLLPDYSNASVSPVGTLLSDSTNSTLAFSGADGVATAVLPVGNYSVYAVGYVGGSVEAAFTSTLAFPGFSSGPLPLPLQPANTLSGTISGTTGGRTAVLVYGAGLNEVTTWASGSQYSIVLPFGHYSVLAISGPVAAPKASQAAIGPATVQYATTLDLALSGAVESRFVVGSPLPTGALFPASAAQVSVSAGAGGPTVSTLASANGTATFVLPLTLPITASSYCIQASSAGFTSASTCSVSPSSMGSMTKFPLALDPVPTTLTVVGLPSGTSVTVNFTALSASATTRTFVGGPTFSFSSSPGTYTVSARAVIGNGTLVYLPSSILNTTIPLGATRSTLTLGVVPAVNSTGTLVLPAGANRANATISLASTLLNVTVNGTRFAQRGFYAAPGTYTAHTTLAIKGLTYTNLTRVTVSASGVVTPSIVLTTPGDRLTGTFVSSSGGTVHANTTVTLTTAAGASLVEGVSAGSFSADLPSNTTFSLRANATVLTSGPNGSYYQTWTTAPGASCTTGINSSSCSVPLVGETNLVWVNGSIAAAGAPGPLAGSVRFIGPYPSIGVAVINTSNGTFSVRLLPGTYWVYATAGGASAPLASLTRTVALPSSAPLALLLTPTWTTTIRVTGPNGSAGSLGPATIQIQSSDGSRAVYPGVVVGTQFEVALPVGTYAVTAYAVGQPYGVATNATATQALVVVAGNTAVNVSLAYQYVLRAAASLVGQGSATVSAGGQATFQFSVRNAGNAPIRIHPVGSPSYWKFNFSFSNVTLGPGPGASTLSAQVVVHVPGATPVAHPPVLIELLLPNGTIAGVVSPDPVVNVVGYYGIAIGPTASGGQVAPKSTLISFYVSNTGNVFEEVRLSVVDGPRLNAAGWNYTFRSTSKPVNGTVGLGAGTNTSYLLNLTASGSVFVPAGSATIQATVLNASGATQAATTLPVPLGLVRPTGSAGSSTLTVTGPGVGSGSQVLPDWVIPLIAFTPAIALAIALVVRRWLKTRRWTRR